MKLKTAFAVTISITARVALSIFFVGTIGLLGWEYIQAPWDNAIHIAKGLGTLLLVVLAMTLAGLAICGLGDGLQWAEKERDRWRRQRKNQ